MDPEKNLHAFVPQTLLTRAQLAAQQEHISLDQLVTDALEQRLKSWNLKKCWRSGNVTPGRAASNPLM